MFTHLYRALRSRVSLTIATAVVTASTVGAVAYATIPDAAGQVHGCYTTSKTLLGPAKGTLRVVDSGEHCRAGENADQLEPGRPGWPNRAGWVRRADRVNRADRPAGTARHDWSAGTARTERSLQGRRTTPEREQRRVLRGREQAGRGRNLCRHGKRRRMGTRQRQRRGPCDHLQPDCPHPRCRTVTDLLRGVTRKLSLQRTLPRVLITVANCDVQLSPAVHHDSSVHSSRRRSGGLPW